MGWMIRAALSLAFALSSASAEIVISEIAIAKAGHVIEDSDGDTPDWIEIHNGGNQAISLDGYFLTDDRDDLKKWKLPNIDVEAQQYLLVFASGKDRRNGELHTNFRLDADGEFLALIDRDGEAIIHHFYPPFPPHGSARSYGLIYQPDQGYTVSPIPAAFAEATPGKINGEAIRPRTTPPPRFSPPRGFYDESLTLSLLGGDPAATIRYTLDGSSPSKDTGEDYTEPISITTTQIVRAIAMPSNDTFEPSEIVTHTYIFPKQIVQQSHDPPEGWPPARDAPSRRDQDYVYGMLSPEEIESTEGEIVEALRSLPTISLVTDLEHWFDSDTGIYHRANGRGRAWERPVSAEWIDPSGAEPGFQINAGIRIRGGGSRRGENPKHAFRLYFRKAYGPAKLRYPIHGESGTDEFDDLCLRTAQNHAWSFKHNEHYTFLRDVFVRDCQRDMGQPHTRSRYCHLYLNGLYWGLFQTQEHSEASYAASYFGGSSSDYDVVKAAGFSGRNQIEATDGDLDNWRRIWEIGKTLAANQDASERITLYQKLQGRHRDGSADPEAPCLIDVGNLIDYMILNLYVGNLDGPIPEWSRNRYTRNWFAIGDRDGKHGFQFFHHDSEKSMERVDIDRTGPYEAGAQFEFSNPQWFHQQLMALTAYRKRFASRSRQVLGNGGVLSPEASLARLRRRIAELEPAVVAESARWGRTGPPYTKRHWDSAVEELLTVVEHRNEIVIRQLQHAKRYESGSPGDALTEAPLYEPRPFENVSITFVQAWGTKGDEPGQFHSPIGIAISQDDVVYVTDLNNARLQKFDTEGRYLGGFDLPHDTPERRTSQAGGIAVSTEGLIYLSFMEQHKLRVYDGEGRMVKEWGQEGSEPGHLRQPGGLAIMGEKLYVADQGNHRVQVFSKEGEWLESWGRHGSQAGEFGGLEKAGSRFGGPHFIATSIGQRIFTTEGADGRVQRLNPNGIAEAEWRKPSNEPGGFGALETAFSGNPFGPIGVMVDAHDRVWISSLNDRVQAFTPDGEFLSGIGSTGSESGQFSRPHGMAMDSKGNLYVVDASNHRVQKFSVTP